MLSFKFDFIKKEKRYSYSFSTDISKEDAEKLCNEILIFFGCFGYTIEEEKLFNYLKDKNLKIEKFQKLVEDFQTTFNTINGNIHPILEIDNFSFEESKIFVKEIEKITENTDYYYLNLSLGEEITSHGDDSYVGQTILLKRVFEDAFFKKHTYKLVSQKFYFDYEENCHWYDFNIRKLIKLFDPVQVSTDTDVFHSEEGRHSYILPIHIPKRDYEDNFLAEIDILRNIDKIQKREDVQEMVNARTK